MPSCGGTASVAFWRLGKVGWVQSVVFNWNSSLVISMMIRVKAKIHHSIIGLSLRLNGRVRAKWPWLYNCGIWVDIFVIPWEIANAFQGTLWSQSFRVRSCSIVFASPGHLRRDCIYYWFQRFPPLCNLIKPFLIMETGAPHCDMCLWCWMDASLCHKRLDDKCFCL